MNKGRLILGIGLIVLAGTIFALSSSANLQFLGLETSNEPESIITKVNSVKSIHTIQADGIVDVHIRKSDSEYVRYVFNEKRFKNNSSFNNGILNIKFPSRNKGFDLFGHSGSGVDVYVSVKSLNQIEMHGVGSVSTDDIIKTNNLKLVNEGTGSMKIDVAAQKIISQNSGVGSMNIKGTADTATISNQGVGSLDAGELVVQVLDARNDGVGSLEVRAEKEIRLRNSGVGSLRYSGDAQVISQRSEGVGSISKR